MKSGTIVAELAAVITAGSHLFSHRMLWLADAPDLLGLFGPKFVSITKPLTFDVTLLSIVVGYAWMLKRAPTAITENVNASLHENAGADPGQV